MFCFATEVLEPFFPLLIHYLTGYWVCMNHGRNETLVQVGYPVKQLIRYVHEGIRYIRITRKPKKKKKKTVQVQVQARGGAAAGAVPGVVQARGLTDHTLLTPKSSLA